MAKYCPNCRNPLEPTDKFCGECGYPVPHAPQSANITGNVSGNVALVGRDMNTNIYPESEVKQCPTCKGRGGFKTATKCEKCHGIGHTDKEVDGRWYYFIGCQYCGGTREATKENSIEMPQYEKKQARAGIKGLFADAVEVGAKLTYLGLILSEKNKGIERAEASAPYGNRLWATSGFESSLDQDQIDEILHWRKKQKIGSGWFIDQSQCTTCLGKGEIRV